MVSAKKQRSLKERVKDMMADAYSKSLQEAEEFGLKIDHVDETTAKLRFAICRSCPNFEPDDERCLICRCPMRYKVTLKNEPRLLGAEEIPITCPDDPKRW